MKLSEEQLNKIETYASQFFSYKEIAILTGIGIDDFINEVDDEDSDIYKYYQKGKLTSESEIREQIIKLAKMGSPAAQQEAIKLVNKQKIKEITNV